MRNVRNSNLTVPASGFQTLRNLLFSPQPKCVIWTNDWPAICSTDTVLDYVSWWELLGH